MTIDNKILMEKWNPVLKADSVPEIQDDYRAQVTATVLENTERAIAEQYDHENHQLNEAAPTNSMGGSTLGGAGQVKHQDPVLISLVRRAMPNLIGFDIAGVQPMSGPTGLVFAMKSKYGNQGAEALFNEADTDFSGQNAAGDLTGGSAAHGGPSDSLGGTDTTPADTVNDAFGVGTGMTTAAGETLGSGAANEGHFAEMSFSIDKTSVTAKSRALKAEYTMELAQDLKAVHGLDAEAELTKILSAEIVAEINRELVRTVNSRARLGAQQGEIAVKGTFNLNTDADGRWSLEKYKGLLVHIEREANQIAIATRRGKGNFAIVSSDVAAALSATGLLDNTSALAGNRGIGSDPTGPTLVGTLHNGMKIYIDPYATQNYINVGYKGTSAFDAGMFYCPYVPLMKVRAVGENTFQPKIGFKTRYGMVANPFLDQTGEIGAVRTNDYYRIFAVSNILDAA